MSPPPPATPRLTLPISSQSTAPDDTVPAECMQTIAQGIGDIYPLPPQVAVDLAADTEYYIRSVLSLALKFMTHSKQSDLQVTHITSALHLLDGVAPLGFRSCREFHKLGFNRISHGLHIPADKHILLHPIRTQPLPPHASRPSVRATWLRTSVANASTPTDYTLERLVRDALHSDAKTAQLSQPLASQPAAACASRVLRVLMLRVSKEARVSGDSAVLRRSLRVTHMLLRNRWHGVEFSFDLAARIILTCLLGRNLGRDDASATRQLAADVLCFAFDVFDAPLFRARALKTIVATLTDACAPLESVYGAVLGVTAAGRDARVLLLEPHLPALIRGLEAAFAAAERVHHPQAAAVRDCVLRICRVISVVTGTPITMGGAADGTRNVVEGAEIEKGVVV